MIKSSIVHSDINVILFQHWKRFQKNALGMRKMQQRNRKHGRRASATRKNVYITASHDICTPLLYLLSRGKWFQWLEMRFSLRSTKRRVHYPSFFPTDNHVLCLNALEVLFQTVLLSTAILIRKKMLDDLALQHAGRGEIWTDFVSRCQHESWRTW